MNLSRHKFVEQEFLLSPREREIDKKKRLLSFNTILNQINYGTSHIYRL